MSSLRVLVAGLIVFFVGLPLTAGSEMADAQSQSVSSSPPPVTQPESPGPTADKGVSAEYVIGPGDGIQVFVWRNPELSVAVPVRPDGRISTPLVEDLIAVGKTPSQLARDIEERLSEYIRSPQVNVIVTNPISRFSEIKVIGQVGNPGSVPYREGMTALDVILEAGGLTEFAAGNRAKVVRKNEDGTTREIKVRLDDLVKKGKIRENVELLPGDLLVVPESYF